MRAQARRRPNIVFILADDLGYGDLRCYNPDSRIPTPNLDRLAAQGMRFTDAHTPSAVCTPTRYGLLTGRYCWRTRLKQGVLDGFDPPLIEQGRMTVASLLRQHGYATGCIGKWHLGMQWTAKDGRAVPQREDTPGAFRPGYDVDYSKAVTGGPLDCGFDTFYGISASLDMSPYCFIENDRTAGIPDERTPEDKSLFMNQVPGVKTKGFTLESVMPALTTRAEAFIARHAGQRPFFLYMPLSSPHLPVVPNSEFEGRSEAGRYGDFVVEMDACVGRVLQSIDRAGAAADTIVMFSSDNGGLWHWWDFQNADDKTLGRTTPRGEFAKRFGHMSNGTLRGTKADAWEGGHRVPLIVRWPGVVKPGSTSRELVCLVDVLDTCASVVGATLPGEAGEDSISLLPALLGRPGLRRDLVLHSLRGVFVLRSGDWKLIEHRGSGGFSAPVTVKAAAGEPSGQLYNLRDDPAETNNLWSAHPEVVRALSARLAHCRRSAATREG
jgi:arylsulfatase A